MEQRQRGRIERYLLNTDRFIWGLGRGNQKKTYSWLEYKGFRFSKAKYGLVIQQLLRDPGLEELLIKIIIPTVRECFPENTLNTLRKFWNLGELPDLKQVSQLKVEGNGYPGPDQAFHWRPFLEIDTQFHYVERWGELAGIWFEEIEPWANETDLTP
ncbi:hypothetical protein DA01_07890 [Dehalococcoides mccartyi]|uniref:Uncharacterized protein n=1 Tax=Dehalococcoides mccartyi TaxID=61435 RepID=A0A0V8M542_9CHLR|nr:hypothetical protein [Dehalococcoides mccartyi]KSV18888.1 hypothetical protein DA01_07890 [Dehalococcoides mccartyi]